MRKMVIDCGGTKIEYAFFDSELTKSTELIFSGNIHQNAVKLKEKLLEIIDQSCDIVVIGIAGYRSYSKKEEFVSGFGENVVFMSDIDLAALAILKNQKGLIGVLGTGSVYAHKTNQLNIIGGYGHTLGDIGSGYHYGKVMFLEYMKKYEIGISDEFTSLVENEFGCCGREILSCVVGKEKEILATLSKKYMDHPKTNDIFAVYFNEFDNYCKFYLDNLTIDAISLSGSITNATRFREYCSAKTYYKINNVKNIEGILYYD